MFRLFFYPAHSAKHFTAAFRVRNKKLEFTFNNAILNYTRAQLESFANDSDVLIEVVVAFFPQGITVLRSHR